MQAAIAPIMRDYLIRFQQTAIKETGRRPLAYLRTPMDEKLALPGCQRPGYVFWQPIAWKDGDVPLGAHAGQFHQSIIDYVSMCQFLEIRFHLPVAPMNSPLSFLYNRIFETCKNTESDPPSRAFEEAELYHREHPALPLAYTMAVTCDGGEPLHDATAGAASTSLLTLAVHFCCPVSASSAITSPCKPPTTTRPSPTPGPPLSLSSEGKAHSSRPLDSS